ncbi:MAG: integrin alpha [Isosphaeraceae bacterium]|jgi:hypothetical protein
MLFGNRGARSSGAKQRKSEAFQPRGEALEQKVLLALPTPGAGYSVAGVGDMNLDPSKNNDYLIGAPGVTQSGSVISPQPVTGTTMSQAFLILGNVTAPFGTIQTWSTNPPTTPEQRVGVLANQVDNQVPTTILGTISQTNPFTNRDSTYSYNFDGVTFETESDPTSGLGAFVAAAGTGGFVIGAPNYTGGGRLYYITATSNLNSLAGTTINLDTPASYPGLTIVTFEDTANPTAGLGSSFADVPNLLGNGVDNLVIGEPMATVTGAQTATGTPATATNTGGVFVFPMNRLPLTAGALNVVQVPSAPFKIAGVNKGDEAGFSVADAGDVNGNMINGANVNDLLIGAPGYLSNAGAAYLVYGGTTLTNAANANNGVVSLSQLQMPITITVPTPPQGAVFVGGNGYQAGYTVSGAGYFAWANNHVYDDFMIGSPGVGRVNLYYGQDIVGLNANATNPIALNNLTTVKSASFVGGSGSRAGFSLSYIPEHTAKLQPTQTSESSIILIGAPSDTGGSGSVYELLGPATSPYYTTLSPQLLNNTIAQQFTLTFPTNVSLPSGAVVGFGTSVSAYAGTGAIGDFIAGGPGYTGTLPSTANGTTSATPLNGAAAVVLLTLQPLLTPLNGIPPTPPTPTLNLGAGRPTDLSSITTTPPPAGVLPYIADSSQGNMTTDPGLGILETDTVSPGPPPPPPPSSPVTGAKLPGTFVPTDYIPPYMFVPTDSALSALNYAPIPLSVALQQYLPPDGFIQRDYEYNHPGKKLPPTLEERGQTQSRKKYGSSGVWTLGSKVFTRGRFHPGKTYQFTHKGRVVPAQLSREKYTSEGNPLGKV